MAATAWEQQNFGAALYRARKDFQNSILHDASLFEEGRLAARDYTYERAEDRCEEVFAKSSFYGDLLAHVRDKHPWCLTPDLKRQYADQISRPVVVYTICVNTGVLYVLRLLQAVLQDRLQINCQYMSPVEYVENGDFHDKGDFFFSETTTPARFLSAERRRDTQFICLVHQARQAMITRNPIASYSARPYAVEYTSTLSHAKAIFPKREIELLRHPSKWQSLLPNLGKDALFTWDPWVWLIQQTWPDLQVDAESKFQMSLFANRGASDDPVRRAEMLAFISLYIACWKDVHNAQEQLTEASIQALAKDDKWAVAFGRAADVVRGTDTVGLFTLSERRASLVQHVQTLWMICGGRPGLVQKLGAMHRDLMHWVSTCEDPERMMEAINIAEELLNEDSMEEGVRFQRLAMRIMGRKT